MRSIAKKIHRFLVDEDGPAAVEYAIMLAFILLACIAAVTQLGQSANTTFVTTSSLIPTGN